MVSNEPRISAQTLKVLVALLSATVPELSGAEIARTSKLPSGTLYPILLRLERLGWLESRWEIEEPSVLGRPRRRFYHATGIGLSNAKAVLNEYLPIDGTPSWAF
jgi:PadR family transcriptional regulator PadR